MVQPGGSPGPAVSAIAAQYWHTGGRAPRSRSFCRAMGAIVPAGLAWLLVALAGGDEGEQLVAVAVQLAGADALDRQQLAAAAGLPLGQGSQRAVVEHHVGGHAVGLGPLAPPGPQLLSQGAVGPHAGPAGPGHPAGHRPGPDPAGARRDQVVEEPGGLAGLLAT